MITVTSPYIISHQRSLHLRRSAHNVLPTPLSLNRTLTPPTIGESRRPSIELLTNANPTASGFIDIITRARGGLKYHDPELCEEGVNGTYFLRDKSGEMVAVFKPQDEEASCENNPKRGEESRRSSLPNSGIRPGEAAAREVAAHFLDHDHLYGVPRTQLVKITHTFGTQELQTKIGSLQEYVEHDGSTEDFGNRSFPVSEIHKIGILDIQTLNVDRHAGNILVRKRGNSMTLIPIDQGFSLLDNLECPWFEWMNWPQARFPFSDEHKAYIAKIDIEKDAQMLQRELGIRPECITTFRIMTTLLQKAAELDLTLYDIGSLVCRTTPGQISLLEAAYAKAQLGIQAKSKIIEALRRDQDAPACSWICDENEKSLIEILFSLLRHSLVPCLPRIERRTTL